MCAASLLALAALYPHPATAHTLVPGMCAALLVPQDAEVAYLPEAHKSLNSYRVHYLRRPLRG